MNNWGDQTGIEPAVGRRAIARTSANPGSFAIFGYGPLRKHSPRAATAASWSNAAGRPHFVASSNRTPLHLCSWGAGRLDPTGYRQRRRRQDPAGNLKPARDKSTERIDGTVAMIMAIGRAMVAQEEPQPAYSLHFV
jgi:hypothetical protein